MTSITRYILTEHAKIEMERRGISETQVTQVLANPEQTEIGRDGRKVYQSRIAIGRRPKTYLLRVFADQDRDPPEVVTVYQTSKLEKYWRV